MGADLLDNLQLDRQAISYFGNGENTKSMVPNSLLLCKYKQVK